MAINSDLEDLQMFEGALKLLVVLHEVIFKACIEHHLKWAILIYKACMAQLGQAGQLGKASDHLGYSLAERSAQVTSNCAILPSRSSQRHRGRRPEQAGIQHRSGAAEYPVSQ